MSPRSCSVSSAVALFCASTLLACEPTPPAPTTPLESRQQALATEDRPLGVYSADTLPAKTAYLTFDDGPSEFTSEFLDTLAAQGIKGTFFINAFNLKGTAGLNGTYVDPTTKQTVVYRSLLKRIQDEGHDLGNHTMNHEDLGLLTQAEVETQLDHNQALVNQALVAAGGKAAPLSLIRPPFGAPWRNTNTITDQTRVGKIIAERGLNMLWNLDSGDSLDWVDGEWYSRKGGAYTDGSPRPYDPSRSAYKTKVTRLTNVVLTDRLVTQGRGIVVLFHDTHPTSRDALAAVINGLRAKGYTFATLEQYVKGKWNRPSMDLTPGPALFSTQVAEKDWGCDDYSGRFDQMLRNRSHEVCGRLWRVFDTYGGSTIFGYPLRGLDLNSVTGIQSQWFQRSRLALNPSVDRPGDVTVEPVGIERLFQLGIDWKTTMQPEFLPEPAAVPGCEWKDIADPVRPIRHNICDSITEGGMPVALGFNTFWGKRVATYGHPISKAYWDNGRGAWVQWFEKARFERVPGSAQPRLAPLGEEILAAPPVIIPDGGVTMDGGVVTPTDAGTNTGSDAGVGVPPDAGEPDAGTPTEEEESPRGGGCGSTSGSPMLWLGVVLLGAVAARRRERQ